MMLLKEIPFYLNSDINKTALNLFNIMKIG